MFFFNDANVRATVWEVSPKEKYTDVKFSTSEKRNDQYIYSVWYARAFGNAHETLKNVKPKTTIVINSLKITHEGIKDKSGAVKSQLSVILFDVAIRDSQEKTATESKPAAPKKTVEKVEKAEKKASKPQKTVDEEIDAWEAALPF